jgi:hypothetical protein
MNNDKLKHFIKKQVLEYIKVEEDSSTGGEGYLGKTAYNPNKKAQGTAHNYLKNKMGWKDAPSIPDRPSKMIDYQQLFEDDNELETIQDKETGDSIIKHKISDKDKETIKKIQALIAKEKNKKLREGNDWPEEVLSRHKDMKFIKQKSFSDKATYQIIDLEDNNKSKGTMTFRSVNNLKDFADDYIKPQGGTISTHLGENNINENYSKFRNETKTRSKSEHYHKAILEVKKRTNELNKLLEYAIRLKQELNQVDEIKSSRHTLNALDKVTENIKEVYIKAKKLK